MDTNWNQLIERYLNGELSAEGKLAFEQQLKENPELQKELDLHQLTQNLIKRAAIRNMVQQSGKSYHFRKTLTTAGIIVLIVAIAALILFLKTSGGAASEANQKEQIEQSLLEEMNKELAFENVDPQYFKFTGLDDIFLSESGILLSITNQSFLLNGKPYKGEAVVQWQEAQTGADIVKAGLSTTSGDQLLETQGMFSLNAFTPDGRKLELSEKGVYVQVPVDELKKDMKLFNGVRGKDGKIDWQAPQEMERLPKLKSMKNMDLFPPKYEPKLNELKWFTDKAKRDSLYLSFDETMSGADDTSSSVQENNAKSADPFNLIENPRNLPPRVNISTQNSIYNNFSSTEKGIIKTENDKTVITSYDEFLLSTSSIGFKDRTSDKDPSKFVHWSFRVEKLNQNEAMVIATINIRDGYSIMPIKLEIDRSGYIRGKPTTFELIRSKEFDVLKPAEEFRSEERFDESEDNEIVQVLRTEIKQKIKLNTQNLFKLNGQYSYQIQENESTYLWPMYGTFEIEVNSPQEVEYEQDSKKHIPPSKVLAIWDKKFDNTILATQDFEDRMKFIHNTCDERVFDMYAKNLNEPLWKLDEKVVKLGYKEFQQFADQRVGSLKLDDVHQQNLQKFYDKAIEEIRSKGKDSMLAALKKEQDWDDDLSKERTDEVMRKGLRESANLNEEYGFNLRNVYRQLGTTVAFQMHGGGTIVNIDKYVWDATVARQSTLITDPYTGKTAQITYNPMKLEVNEAEKYDKLYVYLFSKEINSYQRLDFKNGKLDYNLNGDMNYTAAIVGMNEDGYLFKEISPLKDGDLGKFSLKEVSEKEFEKRINALNKNRTDQPMSLGNELKWLFKEQENYKVQKKRRENAAFRAVIRPTIYSCGQGLTESDFMGISIQ